MPLSCEYEVVLACLDAGPGVDELERVLGAAGASVDWDRVVGLAHWHSVEPLVHESLSRTGNFVPEAARRELRAAAGEAAVRALRLRARTTEICRALTAENIEPMLLKGAALVELVYPNAALRSMADIDMLVHDDELSAAEDIVRSLGYTQRDGHGDEGQRARCHAPRLTNADDTVMVELHRHLFDGTGLPDLEPMWSRARPVPASRAEHLVPAFEDLVFHLAAHFSSDRSSRSQEALRQLVDIDRTIRVAGTTLDWDVVIAEARRFGRTQGLFFAALTVRTLLETPVPAEVLAAAQPAGYTDELGRRFVARRVLDTGSRGPLELLVDRQGAWRRASRRLSPRRSARTVHSLLREVTRPRRVLADTRLNRMMQPAVVGDEPRESRPPATRPMDRMRDQPDGVTIVRATGTSMGASIRAGDWLFVSPDRPRLGDVALVEHDGRLVAHRVIGRRPFRLVGDAGVVAHGAAPETVRGRVVTVVREGTRIELTGVRERVTGLGHVIRNRARLVRRSAISTTKGR